MDGTLATETRKDREKMYSNANSKVNSSDSTLNPVEFTKMNSQQAVTEAENVGQVGKSVHAYHTYESRREAENQYFEYLNHSMPMTYAYDLKEMDTFFSSADHDFYLKLMDLKREHARTIEICETLYKAKNRQKLGENPANCLEHRANNNVEHCMTNGNFINIVNVNESDTDKLPDRSSVSDDVNNAASIACLVFANDNNAHKTVHVSGYDNSTISEIDVEDLSNISDTNQKSKMTYKPPLPPGTKNKVFLRSETSLQSRGKTHTCNYNSDELNIGTMGFDAQNDLRDGLNTNCSSTLISPHSSLTKSMEHVNSKNEEDMDDKINFEVSSKIKDMWLGFSVSDYVQRNTRPKLKCLSKSLTDLTELVNKDETFCKTSSACIRKTWTPNVTIPKPFKMSLRNAKEINVSKTLREYKQKLIEEKKKEMEECQKKFKAAPVPAHVYIPLFDEMLAAQKLKSKERHKQFSITSSSLHEPLHFTKHIGDEISSPTFSKYKKNMSDLKYDEDKNINSKKLFKANPFPFHLFNNTCEELFLEKEELRKARIKNRAKAMLNQSSLPKSMTQRQFTNQEKKVAANGISNISDNNHWCFQPKINHVVPDFENIHNKLQKEFTNKKMTKEATVCKPFQMHSVHFNSTQQAVQTNVLKNNTKITEHVWKDSKLQRDSSIQEDTLPTKMTATSLMRATLLRKKKEDFLTTAETEARKKFEQKSKELNMQKIVALKTVSNNALPRDKDNTKKLHELRTNEKIKLKEYNKQLLEMKQRIKNQPLLFERISQKNAQLAAERKYRNVIGKVGLSDQFIANKVSATCSSEDELEDFAVLNTSTDFSDE